ncbi:unnamed protein product [Coffea canephora]|uniref:Uncharacterized protein n=1 Tax=Coffea canephora TaxID=49390 RepID=A0A068TX36_COFCA|nr:unnamed protein product [Coffea canephora]
MSVFFVLAIRALETVLGMLNAIVVMFDWKRARTWRFCQWSVFCFYWYHLCYEATVQCFRCLKVNLEKEYMLWRLLDAVPGGFF